ncbi:MAG: hypothetical protein IKI99_05210, partial [Firmicutes bacterium]|nr:hypothetical protein [Bacillota bacterium]
MAEGLYQDADNPEVNLYEHLSDDVKEMLNSMAEAKEEKKDDLEDKDKELKDKEKDKVEEKDKEPENLEDPKEPKVTEKDKVPNGTEEKVTENPTAQVEEELDSVKLNEKVIKLQASLSDLLLKNQRLENKLSTVESENQDLLL